MKLAWAQITDGWIVQCDGTIRSSPSVVLSPNRITYIKKAGIHLEIPPIEPGPTNPHGGTAYNTWLLHGNMVFCVANEYVPNRPPDPMVWRTHLWDADPDWVEVPAGGGIQMVLQSNIGNYVNTLSYVWYTESP